jgi:hypothetical protein
MLTSSFQSQRRRSSLALIVLLGAACSRLHTQGSDLGNDGTSTVQVVGPVVAEIGLLGGAEDTGPSVLFSDPDLTQGGVLDPKLAPYYKTIDQIREMTLADLGNVYGKECPPQRPCKGTVEIRSKPVPQPYQLIRGTFRSGVWAAPTAQGIVDYLGKKFSHFDLIPSPGAQDDLDRLLGTMMPVSLSHDYELILPEDMGQQQPLADRMRIAVLAVTQHATGNVWENTESMGRKARQIAVKYRVPVLHVRDLLSFGKMKCAEPSLCHGKTDLGYLSGNDALRVSVELFPALEKNGVDLTATKHRFFFATFAMYAYAQAYAGSITLAQRLLEEAAQRQGIAVPRGYLGSRIITGGGSKDGAATLYVTDVDRRIVASFPSGADALDLAGDEGYYARFASDWGRCGDEEDFVHMPGPSPCGLGWLRHAPGGLLYQRIWNFAQFLPKLATSYPGPSGQRDLFMVYKWSTHDLHYPLGTTQQFWWDTPNFGALPLRQVIAVNHDHGGEYEPDLQGGEPSFMELTAWDLMLSRVLYGRQSVDIEIEQPVLDDPANPKQIIVRGTIHSPDGNPVEGARYFVAKSRDRDFSLSTGIELPPWSDPTFPFSQLNAQDHGAIGPEGSDYGGFCYTWAQTNAKREPVDQNGAPLSDPWGDGHQEVRYLYPFPPAGYVAPTGVLESSGLFVRYPVTQQDLVAPGRFGVDSTVRFEIRLEYDPSRATAVFVAGWDKDAAGEATYDFSRYRIVNQQPAKFQCPCTAVWPMKKP